LLAQLNTVQAYLSAGKAITKAAATLLITDAQYVMKNPK